MIEYSCKCAIPGGVCDWGQLVGDVLSPWGPALPVGALALHRALTFAGVPKRPSLGSVCDPPCPPPGCCSLPGEGLGHLARAGHPCVQGIPAPWASSATSSTSAWLPVPASSGRAELPSWSGIMPSPSGWGGWAGLGWEQPLWAGAQVMCRPSHEQLRLLELLCFLPWEPVEPVGEERCPALLQDRR